MSVLAAESLAVGIEADRRTELLARQIRRKFFKPLPRDVEIARAMPKEIDEVHKLVYSRYTREGIGYFNDIERGAGRRIRETDYHPGNPSFVAKVSGKVVACITGISEEFAGDGGLPAFKLYREEMKGMRNVWEFSNWACEQRYAAASVSPNLMRYCFAEAIVKGAENIAAQVSPCFKQFFRNNLFDRIGDEKSVQLGDNGDKDRVILMRLRLNGLRERAREEDMRRTQKARYLEEFWFSQNPYFPEGWLEKL